jgi:hypothetical protein
VASDGLSPGAVAGIVIGSMAVFALLFILIVVLCRRRELAKRNAAFLGNMHTRESGAP